MRTALLVTLSLILVFFVNVTNCLSSDDDILFFLPAILAGANPPPPNSGKSVRVAGNKLLSPYGNPLFLKIATWENPFEGSVSGQTIILFMDYMKATNLNCILLKANMWLVDDNRQRIDTRVNALRWLIEEAEKRGIYIILNLFDVWSRGRGSNSSNMDSNTHPINVWNWDHRHHAADYIKWVTREFIKHPMVLFELGNEMERNDEAIFIQIAKIHLLPHFYAIAGKDRPIGVSQQPLWSLPVNVIFNHAPNSMPMVGLNDRPVITNELAHDTDLWQDSVIRNPSRSQEYINAFNRAKANNHSGVAAATILNINNSLNDAANYVLGELGKL